jgi:hypothetical protein
MSLSECVFVDVCVHRFNHGLLPKDEPPPEPRIIDFYSRLPSLVSAIADKVSSLILALLQ